MRFGKSVWYAKRINEANAEIAQYSAPVEIVTKPNYFSVMQASTRGYAEIVKYGERLENVWTVIANGRYFDGVFSEGDVMWVDGATPNNTIDSEYGYGASANAVVKNVSEANLYISITLERNQNEVK